MGKDKNQERPGLNTPQVIDQEIHLVRNTCSGPSFDGDVSFKLKKKSDRVEDNQDDPPQNKMKDSGNLLVNPDSISKMMSQIYMTLTQSKKEVNEITTLLQQVSQEQDWVDPIDKVLVEAVYGMLI